MESYPLNLHAHTSLELDSSLNLCSEIPAQHGGTNYHSRSTALPEMRSSYCMFY